MTVAASPQSITNFDAALKDDYGPGLREAVNNSNVVWTEATRNDEDIVGRQAVWSVHTGRSTATGARAELGTLPSADRQRYSKAYSNLAYLYHTIKVSGPAKQLTRNDTGSFVRAMEAEINGAEKDLKFDCNRQSFNDVVTISATDYNGGIVRASGTASGLAWTVFTLNNTTQAATPGELRQLFAGMNVDVINGSTAAVRGSATISSVIVATSQIVVDVDPGIVAGDYIARTGSFGAEMHGLRGLIKTSGSIANLSAASVPSWASIGVGSSTTAISEVLLDQAQEGVETDGDGNTPNLFIFEHAQRRKLASLLQAQKRYDGRQVTLKAGWDGLQVARGTMVCDRLCPSNVGFAIYPKELVRFVGLDFTWDEDDGKVLFKALDGSDAVQARFKTYTDLMTTNRNSHAVITVSTPTF